MFTKYIAESILDEYVFAIYADYLLDKGKTNFVPSYEFNEFITTSDYIKCIVKYVMDDKAESFVHSFLVNKPFILTRGFDSRPYQFMTGDILKPTKQPASLSILPNTIYGNVLRPDSISAIRWYGVNERDGRNVDTLY